jgi:class 3 adenylate cyclase/tetratricopeptide (TPR) repeat protein
VTIVFSDLAGSTALGERLDPEALREVMTRYFDVLRFWLERHGGVVEKYIGDAVMAVFGLPRAHEDDGLRAVRAAAEMKAALSRLNDELEGAYGVRLTNRTGVYTGEVVAGDPAAGQRLVTGDAVNTAARLEQAASGGEILVGESTWLLVAHAVEVDPVDPVPAKGKAEPIRAFRLLRVKPGAPGFRRRLDAPMVGRESELRLLLKAFQSAQENSAGHLVTVVADAGVGKSRLLDELASRLDADAGILRGRCLSYGEGITFWPLAEVVRQAAGITERDSHEQGESKIRRLLHEDEGPALVSERIEAAIGLSMTAFGLEEIFWAVRTFLERLAQVRPLLVIIDDIHWAEEALLDLLQHAARLTGAPLLLACASRPELLQQHPRWAADVPRASVIRLEPLSSADSERLAQQLLGTAHLPPEIVERVTASTQGNPLFVEQMLALWIDQGLLARENGGWAVAGGGVLSRAIPPTISALLTARLDSLGLGERAVLERASVVGQAFSRAPLEALSDEAVQAELPAHLRSLTAKQLIARDPSSTAEDEAFQFLHILIRDAAYDSMLKRARADLHARFADWLESEAGERIAEVEEILGFHLEQAHDLLSELGPTDERAAALARRAVRFLESAGSRAHDREDAAAAVNLFSRAERLIPRRDPLRADILPKLGEALHDSGDLSRAGKVLDEALGAAAETGDQVKEARARLPWTFLQYYTDPNLDAHLLRAEIENAIRVFETVGDEQGLAEAWSHMSSNLTTAGRCADAERALIKTLEYAKRAGDRRVEGISRAFYCTLGWWGPLPIADAIARCEDTLGWAAGRPGVEGRVLRALATLEAMRGVFEEARNHVRESLARFEEAGLPGSLLWSKYCAGLVELLAGGFADAESHLRQAYERLWRMGDQDSANEVACLLAEAVLAQGRADEAKQLSDASQQCARASTVQARVEWRLTRAKVLGALGETREAESLARDAIRMLKPTDLLNHHGEASLALAQILDLGDRRAEAVRYARKAKGLFTRKGNLVSAGKTKAFRLTEALPFL